MAGAISIGAPTLPVMLAYGQPTDWNAEIDKCMISLKAQNPRPGVLLECDEFMPLVPAMITSQMIDNTTEINQNVDEYLTLRVLDVNTEMLEQAKISQQEKDTTAATPIVNNTEDLMIYDEYVREGIMNQIKEECGSNSVTGEPLTYNNVINRENITQTQKDCINRYCQNDWLITS